MAIPSCGHQNPAGMKYCRLAVARPGDAFAESAVREARAILEREGATACLRQLDGLVAERAAPGSPEVRVPAAGTTTSERTPA